MKTFLQLLLIQVDELSVTMCMKYLNSFGMLVRITDLAQYDMKYLNITMAWPGAVLLG